MAASKAGYTHPEPVGPPATIHPEKKTALQEPTSKRELTTREKIILLRSSKLNGSVFPQWTGNPKDSEFNRPSSSAVFTDETTFPLSKAQSEIFLCWRRLSGTFVGAHPLSESWPRTLMGNKSDFVQDITTDCSVVASLCAITSRSEQGHSDIMACIFHPYNYQLRQPTASANGKYIFRLYFNGQYRKVTIDDRLPVSRTSRTLHVIDRKQPKLLWPALVEKAYLKTRGGYDFPGSNSGTDIWILTGWIPEQLFLQSDEIARSALWRRIYNAFNYGDVLITVGTGKLTQNEEDGLGLVGEHDYAILDLREWEGQQIFLIKNPWSEGTVWKGRIHGGKSIMESPPAFGNLQIGDGEAPALERVAPGTFWMSLSDVFQNFESVYLNWNPGLFSYREDVHFNWDLSADPSPEGSLVANPQYQIRGQDGATVWMLLSRHFVSTKESEAGQEGASAQGFVSLYAFDGDGDRVLFDEGALNHSPYVDSPNTLLKLEFPKSKAFTIAVSEQTLPRTNMAFTLSAYSLDPVTLGPAQDKYAYRFMQRGAWTPPTAGGSYCSPSYRTNPQFKIKFDETAEVAIMLETLHEGFLVHVNLVWAQGQQIHAITTRDILGDSGEYRSGCALARISNVPAGVYTIICSTFEQGQLGKFNLRVSSTASCVIDRATVKGAGRLTTKLPSLVFPPGIQRMIAPLRTFRLNRICLMASSQAPHIEASTTSRSPLKLGLDFGTGPMRETLTVTGHDEYLDSQAGIFTNDVVIQPQMCLDRGIWIVLERLAPSGLRTDEIVDIELHSDGPIEAGPWVGTD